jgi:hypothetical protein
MSKVQTKPLTERQIQVKFVSWFRMRYPDASRVFFSVPNGGARNAWTAKNLKDEGALSGVADLILLIPRHGYASLCIEMKKIGGKQSDTQKAFQRAAEEYNNKYVVCYTIEEAQEVVREYLEK